MRFSHLAAWLSAGASLIDPALAMTYNVNSTASIETAASNAAVQMLYYYNGTKPGYAPGILTNPYYWWEAGAMFGVMIHFWALTGNTTLNPLVMDGLLAQKGDGNNFEPANQTKDLGNDDQGFWAYAALDAAEFGFPNPPAGNPSWLSLAQAVFNRQINRWDSSTCGGGLRWQIYSFNPGWNYKNTAANGGLFHIAARLARFTGNDTYAEQAIRLWDWMESVNFISTYGGDNGNSSISVIDGASTEGDCKTNVDGLRWTYNHGTVLMGAAYMYNYTNGSDLWRGRLGQLVNGSEVFFVKQDNNAAFNHSDFPGPQSGQILSEVACETLYPQTCKVDQPAFKAMLIQWMAQATTIASWTAETIYPLLNATAIGAAGQCVGSYGTTSITNPSEGGAKGNWCGRSWFMNTFDGYSGLGEQMSAMSAFQSVLVYRSPNSTDSSLSPILVPATAADGGNSTSDPNAGNTPTNPTIFAQVYTQPVTRGDTAGAWVLTALAMIIIGVGTVWMVKEDKDGWAGTGDASGWMAPSAGSATYYKKTYGYGAYRLAGLQAGGVYKGKSSTARRAFKKNEMPALGLGAGGWWFGTGKGTSEKWWEKDRARHELEQAAKVGPYGHWADSSAVMDDGLDSGHKKNKPSVAISEQSESSTRGFFGRKKSEKDSKDSKKPKGLNGEWKRVGNGVYVRQKPFGDDDTTARDGVISPPPRAVSAMSTRSGAQSPAIGQSQRQSRMPSQRPTRSQSRNQSAAQSRAQSVTRGKSIHWPVDPDE